VLVSERSLSYAGAVTDTQTRQRAKPLSLDERRSAIVDAVIPLLLEHGRDVTTKQIAESAGVAEGTIFRAFGDKDSIIDAAVARFLDPEPLRAMVRAIDPELPLRDRVHDLLFHLQARTKGIVTLMGAVGPGRLPTRRPADEFVDLVAGVLEGDTDSLRLAPEEIAYFLRLIAFATSIGPFNEVHPFTVDQLTDFVVIGILKE
jgi:AcrR family transcriptional regulator